MDRPSITWKQTVLFIEQALFPLIFVMRIILEFGYDLLGNYGLAIIFLSIIVSITMVPLSRIAQQIQHKEVSLQLNMQPELIAAQETYLGEARFNEIEKIYAKYNYHPIKSIRSVLGLLVKIPFLLSALIMLWNFQPFQGISFLIIADLGQPDGLIELPSSLPSYFNAIHILPIVMTLISFAEVTITPADTLANRRQVMIISVLILVLVYPFPSAIVLYWTCSNLFSFMATVLRRFT